jgi:hypothetical protein
MKPICGWSTAIGCVGSTAPISSPFQLNSCGASWLTLRDATIRSVEQGWNIFHCRSQILASPVVILTCWLSMTLSMRSRSSPSEKLRSSELRFFGGLSVEETAAVLKISAITVMRDWNSARAWLYRELTTTVHP